MHYKNSNQMGILPAIIAIIFGIIYIIIRHKFETTPSKILLVSKEVISIINNVVYLVFIFTTLVGIFSLIVGTFQSQFCDYDDMSCVRTDPSFSMRSTSIYNKYPITFYTDNKTLINHIKDWAHEKHYYIYVNDDILEITIITYWTFIKDLYVYLTERSKGFITVRIEGRIRIGYQDFTANLYENVESIYSYLAKRYKPYEYSFT